MIGAFSYSNTFYFAIEWCSKFYSIKNDQLPTRRLPVRTNFLRYFGKGTTIESGMLVASYSISVV